MYRKGRGARQQRGQRSRARARLARSAIREGLRLSSDYNQQNHCASTKQQQAPRLRYGRGHSSSRPCPRVFSDYGISEYLKRKKRQSAEEVGFVIRADAAETVGNCVNV